MRITGDFGFSDRVSRIRQCIWRYSGALFFLLFLTTSACITANAAPPGVPDLSNDSTYLKVVKDSSIAGNAANDKIRAHIVDSNRNPVSGVNVNFSWNPGTGTITTGVTTNSRGDAILQLASPIVGHIAVSARIAGVMLINSNPIDAHFIAYAPVASAPTTRLSVVVSGTPDVTRPSTLLEVLMNGALADGSATNTVRAHITDVNGDPVASQTVVFALASGTATPSGSLSVTTDANGNAVLTLTSTTVGRVDVVATVNGNNISNGSPATVYFVTETPSVSSSGTQLIVVATNALANGLALNTVKAVITDNNGNPVAGQTVAFTMTPGTAVFVGAPQLTTDANGEAIINLQSTVAGPFNITATVNGMNISNGSPATVVFVAGAPDITNPLTALTVTTDSAAADGVAMDVVKAHVVDSFGNPVPGQTVTFTIATGVATPAGSLTLITDANGEAALSLTSTVDGVATITATLNVTSVISNGSPAKITFVRYPDTVNPATTLVVMADNAVADGVSTNSVKAHVADNRGNPIPGQDVVFTIVSGDGTITTVQPVVTDANGDAVIMIVSSKAGNVAVTAKTGTRDIVNGSPARVRFTTDDVWVPRVFTPNGDGTNDIIKPIIGASFRLEFFSVYNRWGNQLFNSRDASQGWDGKLKGVLQPNETYLWIIGGTDRNNVRVQKRGMFTLIR